MGRYDRWTTEEDKKLISLYNAKQPLKQIGLQLNRTERSIGSRITVLGKKGLIKPHKILKTPKNYYKYDLSNFESLTPSSAYFVISVLCDGYLTKNSVHFGYRKRDTKDFRDIYASILNVKPLPRITPIMYKHKTYGHIQFYNRKLVEICNTHFGVQIGRKTGLIRTPKQIMQSNDPKIHGAVMRASYECEGNVSLNERCFCLSISNTSRLFIQDLSRIFDRYHISYNIYGIQLRISSLEGIIRFYNYAYHTFDFKPNVKAKKYLLEKLLEKKSERGCVFTHYFNEIEFKEVLKDLIRLKFILGYNNDDLKKWLNKKHKVDVGVHEFSKWTSKDKIMRVFGKSRKEIIEKIKMETL
jgi:hypothetical protein